MADENTENCSHNCSSCGKDCKSRDLRAYLRKDSSVKKVIGVVSGKGGVGKSLVTNLLAVKMLKKGYHTAILDADITGPSIPTAYGLGKVKAESEQGEDGQYYLKPVKSKGGIDIMSMNMLLPDETDPVYWRGPVIGGAVKQFWTDVQWKDVDYMFVDMPPGTGDVPLTVFQSLPVDAIVVVTTPQQLVSVIVEKAVKFAGGLKVPILGLVENMSYVKCPDCNKEIKIFGESNADKIAKEYGLPLLARIPMEERITKAVDTGAIEELDVDYLDVAVKAIEELKKA